MAHTAPSGMADATDLKALRRHSLKAATFLKALSNRERLLLLCTMVGGERCVSDLQELCGITQPTLSQQLGVLRRQGMVKARREGKRIFYSIKDPAAVAVLETLHGIYCPVPAGGPKPSRTASD